MKSADQATWVMNDLNDMLFVVSSGPRPVQASMAMAGMGCFPGKCSLLIKYVERCMTSWDWTAFIDLLFAFMDNMIASVEHKSCVKCCCIICGACVQVALLELWEH